MKQVKTMCLLLCVAMLVCCGSMALSEETLHPGMITITSGQSIGDGSYINHTHGGYPFIATFMLDEATMPVQSCRLGVYSWDCDEDASTYWHNDEFDVVHVNGRSVGVITGQDETWKTSYFNVPLDALKLGQNEIRIYVGHKDRETGETVQNTDDWLLEVKWLSLQFDGGKSDNAPEKFSISLSYANKTESGITCGANAVVQSSQTHSYVIEYSLVDKTSPSSGTYNQIIADDEERVSGTNINSTGHFFLNSDAPMGSYEIQATLRDPVTNEVYAYTTRTFDMGEALYGSCEHVAAGAPVFYRTEIYKLDKDDNDYAKKHKAIDIYKFTCTKCGATYYDENNLRKEDHTLPVCVCGFVEAGYNPIHSAVLRPLNQSVAGEMFRLEVVTDKMVAHVKATNNSNTELRTELWQMTENGDGTRTFFREYKADIPAAERYWQVKAYSDNNRYLSTRQSNKIQIFGSAQEAEKLTECNHSIVPVEEHPHQKCVLCEEFIDTEDTYKFSDCEECYPKAGTIEAAKYFAHIANLAYGQDGTEGFKRIELKKDGLYGDVEIAGKFEKTADGKAVFSLGFEGSKDLADWVNDFAATADYGGDAGQGVHTGFNELIQYFLDNGKKMTFDYEDEDGKTKKVTLMEIIEMASNGEAEMHITGHSLGGALAQVFTYYMNEYYDVPADNMVTYTFASPIPFLDKVADNTKEQLNVHNFINTKDVVPKLGVAEGIDALEEFDIQFVQLERKETDLPSYSVELDRVELTKFDRVESEGGFLNDLKAGISNIGIAFAEGLYNTPGVIANGAITVTEGATNAALFIGEKTIEVGNVLYNAVAPIGEALCNGALISYRDTVYAVELSAELMVNPQEVITGNLPSLLYGDGGYNIDGRHLGKVYYFSEGGNNLLKNHDMSDTYLSAIQNAESMKDFRMEDADKKHSTVHEEIIIKILDSYNIKH